MTYQEFQERIKKKSAPDKYGSYFIAMLLLGVGVYFTYLLTFTNWYVEKQLTTENIVPLWMLYGFVVSLVLAGIYGFWRIPQECEIYSIDSEKTVVEKRLVVDRMKEDFKLTQLPELEGYTRYSYIKRFRVRFCIAILLDKNSFHFNVQRMDTSSGIIDFSSSKRATREVRKKASFIFIIYKLCLHFLKIF